MTREFLKQLGIEDKAVVDKIMEENGKDINSEKATLAAKVEAGQSAGAFTPGTATTGEETT